MEEKKIMKKKMLCAFLACMMTVTTVLTGCGNKEAASSQQEKDTAAQSTEAASAQEEAAQPETGDLEKVEVTIMAMRGDANTPWEDTEMIKRLEEECKDFIDITWIDLPGSMKDEKLNLAFNSGEYPDVLLGTWALEPVTMTDYASQGILIPLDPYFTEDIMPNWSNIIEQRPELVEGLTLPDGHVYCMTSRSEGTLRDYNDTVLINTEWLEKVNMEMPTTTDELYEVLKAFKEAGDLNGNGKADEIPLSCMYGASGWGDHIQGLYSMCGWFGIAQNQQGMQMKDDKIIFNAAQSEFKDAISYFNKLYSEGLMDMEAFTMSGSAYTAKTNDANPAMVGVYPIWNDVSPNKVLGKEVYQYLAPLKSDNGAEPQWARRYTPAEFNRCAWVTDKAAGKEVQIMKFIDKFYELDNSIAVSSGALGKYIEKVGDNLYHEIKDENGNSYTGDVKSADSPIQYAPYYIMDGQVVMDEKSESQLSQERSDALYKPYVQPEPTFVNAWVSKENSEELSLIAPEIQNYVRECTARWITEGGVEEEWDAYIDKLNDLGVNEWMSLMVKEEFQDKIERVE